jgi:hypothetical protein
MRGMPLAVLVPGCNESPMAYTDATQSSARTGMLSKQNRSAAINHRMGDPPVYRARRAARRAKKWRRRSEMPLQDADSNSKRAAAVLVPKLSTCVAPVLIMADCSGFVVAQARSTFFELFVGWHDACAGVGDVGVERRFVGGLSRREPGDDLLPSTPQAWQGRVRSRTLAVLSWCMASMGSS